MDVEAINPLKNVIKSWYYGDTALFTISCAEIMYSWFYTPETLPPTYVKWISKMADMDHRLLDFLKLKRLGYIEYGKHSDMLSTYCLDNGFNPSVGDTINGFLDCQLVRIKGLI